MLLHNGYTIIPLQDELGGIINNVNSVRCPNTIRPTELAVGFYQYSMAYVNMQISSSSFCPGDAI